jgi:hypothetical protein
MKREPDANSASHNEPPSVVGPLTRAVKLIVVGLKMPIERWVVRPYWTVKPSEAEARTRWADYFLGLLLLLDALGVFALRFLHMHAVLYAVLPFFSWRILDIVATATRITLFAEEPGAGVIVPLPVPARAVVYGFTYFFESIICFGAVYAAFPNLLSVAANKPTETASLMDAMHLSFVTAFTIGYGDVAPIGWLRPVAWAQGACSLILVVLMVGRYVGLLQATGRRDRA